MDVRFFVLALAAWLLDVGSASAEAWEVESQLSVGGYYNTSYGDIDDSGMLEFAPRVAVRSSQERYRVNVSYQPRVKLLATGGWANAWDHVLNGALEYELGELTTLSVRDSYTDLANFNFEEELLADGTVDVNTGTGFERSRRNHAEVTLQHFLSPLWVLSGTASHSFANFNESSRSDSQTLNGYVGVNRAISARQNAGLGVSATHSVFDESTEVQGERYSNVQIVASYQYSLEHWLRFQFRGGPALQFIEERRFENQEAPTYLGAAVGSVPVFYDYYACPRKVASSCIQGGQFGPVPSDTFGSTTPAQALVETQAVPVEPNPESGDFSVTFFGTASVLVELGDWAGNLYFQRTESNDSGQGSATSVSTVGFSIDWEPTYEWQFVLTANWSLRESLRSERRLGDDYAVSAGPPIASPGPTRAVARISSQASVPVSHALDIHQYVLGFRVKRRLTEHMLADAGVGYVNEQRPGRDAINRARVSLQIVYSFRKIRF